MDWMAWKRQILCMNHLFGACVMEPSFQLLESEFCTRRRLQAEHPQCELGNC